MSFCISTPFARGIDSQKLRVIGPLALASALFEQFDELLEFELELLLDDEQALRTSPPPMTAARTLVVDRRSLMATLCHATDPHARLSAT